MYYRLRKYCFTNRVINMWISLSNYVVSASPTIIFNSRLDKFGQRQDITYHLICHFARFYSLVRLHLTLCV